MPARTGGAIASSIRASTSRPGPAQGQTVTPLAACEVLIKDRFPAYITWERFEAIRQRLADNRAVSDALGHYVQERPCSAA